MQNIICFEGMINVTKYLNTYATNDACPILLVLKIGFSNGHFAKLSFQLDTLKGFRLLKYFSTHAVPTVAYYNYVYRDLLSI